MVVINEPGTGHLKLGIEINRKNVHNYCLNIDYKMATVEVERMSGRSYVGLYKICILVTGYSQK
jgi:hypothetical protein